MNTSDRMILWQKNFRPASTRTKKSFCHKIILPATLLVLSACSTFRNREPEWVRNPKSVYPENQYLVSVGEGDTRQAAENASEANLSRIFEAHIESDERMVDTVKETRKDFSRKTDLTTDINILSSQTLFNIQHAEAWKDETGRYHAVAYLDRRDTAAIYRDKIDEQSRKVESLMGYADHASRLLDKYAQLRAANRAAAENDLLLRQLKVIHPPTAAACVPDYSLNDLQKALVDTAKQIRVQIAIDGDVDGRMKACLEELITRYGFVVGAPAVLDISGKIAITDTGKRTAGLAFFRYMLSVQIKDTGNNILAAINEKGREAVASPDEARARCYRTLENAIRISGVQRLDAYFDSLVNHTD